MEPEAAERLVAKVSAALPSQLPHHQLRQEPPHNAIAPPTLTAPSEEQLTALLLRDTALFLEKWGSYLQPDDFALFAGMPDEYEVQHWIKHYTIGVHTSITDTQRRNRRLNYLSTPSGADAFSLDALDARAPHALLVEYRRPNARLPPPRVGEFPEDIPLVDRIYEDYDRSVREEEQGIVEYDTDDEEEEDDEQEEAEKPGEDGEMDGMKSSAKRGGLEEEYRELMIRRFLDGLDTEFDYTPVDNDVDLDFSQMNSDAMDRYFDDEDSEGEASQREDNGELDY
ncbi:hypothetical protein DFJ77DRAFT_436511 [Powellomyces hirtus]|nr:hypothetical protein DFJ77DRAFT_436511 [Powellomyces hirtus]